MAICFFLKKPILCFIVVFVTSVISTDFLQLLQLLKEEPNNSLAVNKFLRDVLEHRRQLEWIDRLTQEYKGIPEFLREPNFQQQEGREKHNRKRGLKRRNAHRYKHNFRNQSVNSRNKRDSHHRRKYRIEDVDDGLTGVLKLKGYKQQRVGKRTLVKDLEKKGPYVLNPKKTTNLAQIFKAVTSKEASAQNKNLKLNKKLKVIKKSSNKNATITKEHQEKLHNVKTDQKSLKTEAKEVSKKSLTNKKTKDSKNKRVKLAKTSPHPLKLQLQDDDDSFLEAISNLDKMGDNSIPATSLPQISTHVPNIKNVVPGTSKFSINSSLDDDDDDDDNDEEEGTVIEVTESTTTETTTEMCPEDEKEKGTTSLIQVTGSMNNHPEQMSLDDYSDTSTFNPPFVENSTSVVLIFANSKSISLTTDVTESNAKKVKKDVIIRHDSTSNFPYFNAEAPKDMIHNAKYNGRTTNIESPLISFKKNVQLEPIEPTNLIHFDYPAKKQTFDERMENEMTNEEKRKALLEANKLMNVDKEFNERNEEFLDEDDINKPDNNLFSYYDDIEANKDELRHNNGQYSGEKEEISEGRQAFDNDGSSFEDFLYDEPLLLEKREFQLLKKRKLEKNKSKLFHKPSKHFIYRSRRLQSFDEPEMEERYVRDIDYENNQAMETVTRSQLSQKIDQLKDFFGFGHENEYNEEIKDYPIEREYEFDYNSPLIESNLQDMENIHGIEKNAEKHHKSFSKNSKFRHHPLSSQDDVQYRKKFLRSKHPRRVKRRRNKFKTLKNREATTEQCKPLKSEKASPTRLTAMNEEDLDDDDYLADDYIEENCEEGHTKRSESNCTTAAFTEENNGVSQAGIGMTSESSITTHAKVRSDIADEESHNCDDLQPKREEFVGELKEGTKAPQKADEETTKTHQKAGEVVKEKTLIDEARENCVDEEKKKEEKATGIQAAHNPSKALSGASKAEKECLEEEAHKKQEAAAKAKEHAQKSAAAKLNDISHVLEDTCLEEEPNKKEAANMKAEEHAQKAAAAKEHESKPTEIECDEPPIHKQVASSQEGDNSQSLKAMGTAPTEPTTNTAITTTTTTETTTQAKTSTTTSAHTTTPTEPTTTVEHIPLNGVVTINNNHIRTTCAIETTPPTTTTECAKIVVRSKKNIVFPYKRFVNEFLKRQRAKLKHAFLKRTAGARNTSAKILAKDNLSTNDLLNLSMGRNFRKTDGHRRNRRVKKHYHKTRKRRSNDYDEYKHRNRRKHTDVNRPYSNLRYAYRSHNKNKNNKKFKSHYFNSNFPPREKLFVREILPEASSTRKIDLPEEFIHHKSPSNEEKSQIIRGELTSKIVAEIFGEIEKCPNIEKSLGSSLENIHKYPCPIPNLDVYHNNEVKEDVQRLENMLHDIMKALNKIIEEEVRAKTCIHLDPESSKFLKFVTGIHPPAPKLETADEHINCNDLSLRPIRGPEDKIPTQNSYLFATESNLITHPAAEISLSTLEIPKVEIDAFQGLIPSQLEERHIMDSIEKTTENNVKPTEKPKPDIFDKLILEKKNDKNVNLETNNNKGINDNNNVTEAPRESKSVADMMNILKSTSGNNGLQDKSKDADIGAAMGALKDFLPATQDDLDAQVFIKTWPTLYTRPEIEKRNPTSISVNSILKIIPNRKREIKELMREYNQLSTKDQDTYCDIYYYLHKQNIFLDRVLRQLQTGDKSFNIFKRQNKGQSAKNNPFWRQFLNYPDKNRQSRKTKQDLLKNHVMWIQHDSNAANSTSKFSDNAMNLVKRAMYFRNKRNAAERLKNATDSSSYKLKEWMDAENNTKTFIINFNKK